MKSGIAKTIVKIVPATFKLETAMVNWLREIDESLFVKASTLA